ncbi:MAG TPA: hypothetical protein VNN22_08930 [Verrucomicrobiae bacterium]|nr:hypothetical protein [Verrucomicrobiae bacterium]
MKTFFWALVLAGLTFFRASAQVTVEVVTEQDQFLPSEALPVAVKITNRSGQPLHLGASPNWLTFDVESADGIIVVKKAEVPVIGEFDVGSSQVATKRVDLAPYFGLSRPGRYRIVATVRIQDWRAETASPPKNFDVITGAKIWSQDFGVPIPSGVTNRTPEVRKYTLQKANYLRTQLRLYVQVSDPAEAQVFKVVNIGKTVSFSTPDAQLDRSSNLHLLWQSGAAHFTYAVVNPDGELVRQEVYDYVAPGPRPRLNIAADGTVTEYGGVRRLQPEPMPMVKAPNDLPSPQSP